MTFVKNEHGSEELLLNTNLVRRSKNVPDGLVVTTG
jgi:hypothetical protein